MKYLVLLGVVLVVYFIWRGQRLAKGSPGAAPEAGAAPALPQDMVRCPVCAVHLPRGDALADARGRLYCCAEHRLSDSGSA